MSPAEGGPSADDIARAVVAAARLEGEDPIAILTQLCVSHARVYFLLALAQEFPTVNREALCAHLRAPQALSNFRTRMRIGKLPWFSLDRLNAVRAACGWSAMTLEQALAAPLIHCGRTPATSPVAEDAPHPPAAIRSAAGVAACEAPDAGPGGEKPPASITTAAPAPAEPAAVTTSSPGREGGQDPARILNAKAKASVGNTPEAEDARTGTGLRVGAAKGAHPSPGAGAGFGLARADGGARATKSGASAGKTAPRPAAAALAQAAMAMRKPGPLARVIDRRPTGGSVTAAFCGDPPPGRSALDARGTR